MLKLKPNLRELVLLLVLAALSMGVAWYYLFFTPLNDSLVAAKEQLATAQLQLEERKQWQQRDAQTRQRLQQLQEEQAELQAQFDPISSTKDVIDNVVGLTRTNNTQVTSIELGAEQVTMAIQASSYTGARSLLESLEQSPSFSPGSVNISMDRDQDGGYTVRLQAKLTWGQAAAGDAEVYPRTVPFGR